METPDASKEANHLLVAELDWSGARAISFQLPFTQEAQDLVRMMHRYQNRDQELFKNLLKVLLDTYGLRKDQYDRVAECDHDGCPLDQLNKDEVMLKAGLIYKRTG